MGSPCELLCEATTAGDAERLASMVASEAWRVEDKLSRYLSGNIIDRINSADGQPVRVDDETAQMLDFASTLFVLSDGAFDITSGVLRRAWTFDGSDGVPTTDAVAALLDLVGWGRVSWQSPLLTLPAGMEIDLGGIGKEYAVDRAILQLRSASDVPCLVNFGGDLAVTSEPHYRSAWTVGIESPDGGEGPKRLELRQGALATSGDARRYLQKDDKRYGHVLDPRTGWPIEDAPSSITVAADTCTQAGMLSTLAMLKGSGAESFLAGQSEKYWCGR
jgi:thiamine biosynthesis lipoprotein